MSHCISSKENMHKLSPINNVEMNVSMANIGALQY